MMKLLRLDDAEENLLHWLVQCCLSDNLLLKSGIPPDMHEQYLKPVRTLDAKLKEFWARENPGSVPECGELVGVIPGVGSVYCTRPACHAPSANGKPGHVGEIKRPSQ
jgi:hypothetical protein